MKQKLNHKAIVIWKHTAVGPSTLTPQIIMFKVKALENILTGSICFFDEDLNLLNWRLGYKYIGMGVAIHDIKEGDIVDFDVNNNTKDISVNEVWEA